MNCANLAYLYLKSKGTKPTKPELKVFRRWLYLNFARIAPFVDFTTEEVSPNKLLRIYEQSGRLLISTAHNHHPFWLPWENAWFRAVHDWHHLTLGAEFDLAGEAETCRHAIATAPESIGWILQSEILLQAAASIHTGKFQRQKLIRSEILI